MAQRLTGKMARGKFRGIVEMTTADGITTHAKFVDGTQAGKWLDGAAPEATKPKAIAQQPAPTNEESSTAPIAAPAEGPAPSAAVEIDRAEPASSAAESTTTRQGSTESDSLRSLTAPPASLPKTDFLLSRAEVIRAADEEAVRRGLNVGEYQSRKVNYNSALGTWTVSYEQSGTTGGSNERKHFAVIVEDKTTKASVAPEE